MGDRLIQEALREHDFRRLWFLPLVTITPDRGVVATLISWTVVANLHALRRNGSNIVTIVLRLAIERNRFLDINVFDIGDTWPIVLVEGLVAVRHVALVEFAVLFLRGHVAKLAVHVEARVQVGVVRDLDVALHLLDLLLVVSLGL